MLPFELHPRRLETFDLHAGAHAGRHIPGDLKVHRHLRITHFPRLRTIGDGLNVPGDLTIGGFGFRYDTGYEKRRIPIREFPRGVRVGGSLTLKSCFRLLRLPDDLRFGGSLVIEDCDALETLPDPLVVHGSLTITGGQSLTKLPSRLRVDGDFRLSGTRVTELPPGLIVGKSLVIEGRSRVASLPADLSVFGDLVLRNTPIESLPDGLNIRGTLRLPGSRRLKRLPAGLVVPGKLDLADCTALEEVPAGLKVGHSLKLRGCRSLRVLPEGLEVPYTLDLRGCIALPRLPGGLRLGHALPGSPATSTRNIRASTADASRRQFTPALRLADCPNLTELPDDLIVGGPIEVAGSGLRGLPPSLRGARLLWRGVLVEPDVVFHPERLKAADVLRQPNAELRHVIIERFGIDRLLAHIDARTVDADLDAGGERRLVHVPALNQRFLVCRCPSTARQYLLRVPPDTATCRHAAAWSGEIKDPEQYRPRIET